MALGPLDPSWVAQLITFDRDGDSFRAPRPTIGPGRLFGGLIAAQALAAAGATIDADKHPQSLHAYFVQGGVLGTDVVFHVDRMRDGRSFSTRRVSAHQNGTLLLEMLLSFHRPEDGPDLHPPMPDDIVPVDDATPVAVTWGDDRIEMRAAEPGVTTFRGTPYWSRHREPIEGDPLTTACALTFSSDIGLMGAARPPGDHEIQGGGQTASLDHSVWFHRPFHPDRWHLYWAERKNVNDARGLAGGAIYRDDGVRIASTQQECLWRV